MQKCFYPVFAQHHAAAFWKVESALCSGVVPPARPPASPVAALLLESTDIIRGDGCNCSLWTDIHRLKASAATPINLAARGQLKKGVKFRPFCWYRALQRNGAAHLHLPTPHALQINVFS